MASWSKDRVEPNAINGGREFTTDDNLALNELNAIVNNSFYASEKSAEALGKINDIIEHEQGTVVTINDSPQAEWKADFIENERQKTLNLYPIKQYTFTDRGLTFSVLDDGTLHITGITNSAGSVSLVQVLPTFKIGKNYTFSMQNLVNNISSGAWDISIATPNGNLTINPNSTTYTKSFNSDTNATSSVFYINSSGITVDISCKLMLNEGDIVLDFIKYDGEIIHRKDLQKNIITAYLNLENFILSAERTYEIIPLNEIKAKIGDKLIFNSNGTITIGSGVSYIKVSALVYFDGEVSGQNYAKISKNNDISVLGIVDFTGVGKYNTVLPNFVLPVQKNDVISLQAHVGNISNKVSRRTYLTVEVIE